MMAEIMAKQTAQGNNPMAGLTYDPTKYNNNTMGSGAGPQAPFK
jgi:hypothetical protein